MKSNYDYQKDIFSSLQKNLGYKFNDPEKLLQALTRTSAISSNIQDKKVGDNQRLEFLGDKVLNLVIADILMDNHPKYSEGELTHEVSRLVKNNGPLLNIAQRLQLDRYIIMDRGEEINNNGRDNKRILADTMEAIIGAIFLDSGRDYKLVTSFIRTHWHELKEPSQCNKLFELIEELNQLSLHDHSDHSNAYKQTLNAIMNGADIRAKNKEGKTIFHLMERQVQVDLIENILEKQKNWSGIDLRGITQDTFEGYEYATDDVYYHSIDFIGINLSNSNLQGVDLSSRTIRNVDFTNANLTNVDFSSVEFYNTVFTGANLQGADFRGCSMDTATRQSYRKATHNIIRSTPFSIKIDTNELFEAVSKNDIEQVRYLIDEGVKINIKNNIGATPLHIAAGHGYKEITKLLLDNKADINTPIQVYKNYGIMDILSESNIKMMMQLSARIGQVPIVLRTKDSETFGATSLHLAAGNGHKDIVALLLTYGAESNRKEWDGITPCYLAEKYNQRDTVGILVANSLQAQLFQQRGQDEQNWRSRFARNSSPSNNQVSRWL